MSAFKTQKTYFQPGQPIGSMGMRPSLLRARRKYRWRNAATAVALVGFIVGAFSYSIGAVAQEDFADVEAFEQLNRKRLAEEEAVRSRLAARSPSEPAASSSSPAPPRDPPPRTRPDGSALSEFEAAGFEPVPAWLRAGLDARSRPSWIVGAGNVDAPGRIGDARPDSALASLRRV